MLSMAKENLNFNSISGECQGWNDPINKQGLFREGKCRYKLIVQKNDIGFRKYCEIDFRNCKIRITETSTPNGTDRESIFICKHNSTVILAQDFLLSDMFQQIWSGALGSEGKIPK